MTHPAQHIPGLITTNGTQPNQAPGQPVPAAQPGTVVPGQVAAPVNPAVPAAPVAVAPATAQPAVVSSAVQPAPAATDPGAVPQQPVMQLPTNLLPQQATTTTAGAVPGLNTATVPGLNPPAPAPAAAAPSTPAPAEAPPATGDADRGYPQGTPLEQMSAEQREAYWKHHARQWEARSKEKADYDALKTKAEQYDQYLATQATEQDKALAAAKAAGYQEAAGKAAVVLVDAHVRAGLMGRLGPDQVEVLATNLNHQHFLAADGLSVDAAKVATFVATVAPQQAAPAATAPAVPAVPGALPVGVPQSTAQQSQQPATGLPRSLPDLGQGAQTTAPLDKLEAGRLAARQFLADGGSFR